MKHALFATTAIAVALSAQPVVAEVTNARDGALDVTVSGNVRFEAGLAFSEDNDAAADRDGGFRSDSFVQFNAVGTNEAGLRYGLRIDLDDIAVDTDVDVDEVYMFVGGDWGQIRFGDKEGVINTLNRGAPGSVGSGGFDGSYGRYTVNGGASYSMDGISTGDVTRVTYLSPSLEFGDTSLDVGVSYAPTDTGGEKNSPAVRTSGAVENIIDVGGRITGSSGSFDYGISAAYARGDNVADGADDVSGYRLGVDASFGLGSGALGMAMGYYSQEDNDVDTSSLWGAVDYSVGSLTIGANVVNSDVGASDDHTAYAVGVQYDIATGLDAYADVTSYDRGGDNGDGTVGLAGIRVSF
jgi:hypothetical protein